MNKERYLKLKKDFIVLYLARNGIMTFLITLFTFSLDLSNYYQISFPATIPYIFFNNIFSCYYQKYCCFPAILYRKLPVIRRGLLNAALKS